MPTKLLVVLSVAAGWIGLGAVFAGCSSMITGNEGNFDFSYIADDDIRNFNKPIAVQGRLDLEVWKTQTSLPVALTSADTDDPAVLEAESFSGNTVTLLGTGDGNTLVSVAGSVDGEQNTDSVNMRAATPEVMRLEHNCSGGETSANYLAGEEFTIWYEMELEDETPVIGYGYRPVSFSPAGSVELMSPDSRAQFYFNLRSTGPGSVLIAPTIGDSVSQALASITAVFVDEADIDGVIFTQSDLDATVGAETWYYVLPSIADEPICQANINDTFSSSTTAFCTVIDPDAGQDEDTWATEYGWFRISGVAEGTCEFTVTYPGADNGVGVSETFSVHVAP